MKKKSNMKTRPGKDRRPHGPKTALEAKELSKHYGNVKALDKVNFMVNKGEIFGLLGSNGAGKTTALKIFSGLVRATSGQTYIFGKRIKGNELWAKSMIGYLPETPTLYETLTGFELLDLVSTLRNMEEKKKQKRIKHLSRVMELDSALDDQVGTYSKGMRQKLAFAAAVIHSPKIILLDEPTAGLDPRFGNLFKRWIRNFGAQGQTVLMSTHLTLIAEEICDRVGVIDKGKVLKIGTVTALKQEYDVDNLEKVFIKIVGGKDWLRLLPSSR